MRKLLIALLLGALWLTALCPALAQGPEYASTAAFVEAWQREGLSCTLGGVDEDGDESVSIECTGMGYSYTIELFFSVNGRDVSAFVWYLASYEDAQLPRVLEACSTLNAASRQVCFFADESDNTVTASMDLLFTPENAGGVTRQAVLDMMGTVTQAHTVLENVLTFPDDPIVVPSASVIAKPGASQAAAGDKPRVTIAQSAVPEEVIVAAHTAILRGAPAANGSYVYTSFRGDVYKCLGVSGRWYIVQYKGGIAFLSMDKAVGR